MIAALLFALCSSAPCALSGWNPPETYAVLVGFESGDPYHAAARRLAAHHGTKHLIRFDPHDPEAVLPILEQLQPTHVAIVLRPEQIDVNSVRKILRMATKVDADPFVDFDYGYITGSTAEEALQFIKNIVETSKRKLPRKVGQTAVWGNAGKGTATDEPYRIGHLSFPSRSLRFRAPDGEQGRDQAFLDENLRTIEGCGAIIMGGHGMPWEIVSGPRAEDMDRLDLFPSIVLNYACYTAVTGTYSEREWSGRNVLDRLKEIETRRSFALAVIRRGAVGYVAYVTPRPAGPEMTTDFQRILTGETMGAVRRRDYAKVLLGYLGFGENGIVPPEVVDGEGMPRAKLDSVRHMMLDSATGGILYGDPAYQPYPVVRDALPLSAKSGVKDERLHVTLRLRARDAYLWGADPFRRFDENTRQMAMKLYDRVVVPKRIGPIRSVSIESATWGGQEIEVLPVVWAEEHDRGERYLHVKANFARNAGRGDIEIRFVAGPEEMPPVEARRDGGEAPAAKGVLSVRALNRKLLRDPSALTSEIGMLQDLGKEGFAAVIELIRAGEAHHMTDQLLRYTKIPGGERELLELARGEPLPNYGTWTALRGLGLFDTPEVRSYLLERLATDRDPGTFMSAAQALAMLEDARGVRLVAKRLMHFEKGDSGVQWQLVHAMAEMGGERAVEHLAAYVLDERATHEVAITYALDHLAKLDEETAKETVDELQRTERYRSFQERTRKHIEGTGR
jgi:hypothetical protein